MNKFALILALSLAMHSLCAQNTTHSDNLDRIAFHILKESPFYKNGELSLETSVLSLKSDANLPDPELGGEFLAAPADESDRWAAELSWDLEWPGVYESRKKGVKSKNEVLINTLNLERRDKLIEIKELLLNFVLQSKKLKLIENLSSANDSIYKFASLAAKEGHITLIDLNKIRLENAALRGSKAILIDEMSTTKTDLTLIYGKDCGELLDEMIIEFPEFKIPETMLDENIASASPEMRLADSETKSLKAEAKTARMAALPGISFGYKHAYEDGMHFNGATLGITLPLFSSRHKSKAAQAALNEAEYNAVALQNSISEEINLTVRRLLLMQSQIEEIESLLTATDHNALLMKAYENGTITLLDYLTERNYFTNATLDFLELKYSAALTSLKLEKYLPLNF